MITDFLARWHRSDGHETYFLTGTDEHGEKVNNAAAEAGCDTPAFVDRVSQRFRDAWQALDISQDDFIRTTEERHKRVVRALLQRVHDAGDVYFGEYEGLYGRPGAVRGRGRAGRRQAAGGPRPADPAPRGQLVLPHGEVPPLAAGVPGIQSRLGPDGYRSEVLGLLREPVGDLSISRPRERLPWGIGMPWDDSHVIYVCGSTR